MNTGNDPRPRSTGWADVLRGPWSALCAAAAVVLGPAAHTASTLMQANAAPRHQALAGDRGKAGAGALGGGPHP